MCALKASTLIGNKGQKLQFIKRVYVREFNGI